MNSIFEVAAGSIMGRDHARPLVWRNNQDAYSLSATPDTLVAVIADGCGSSPHSEIGAKLGSRWVAEAAQHFFGDYQTGDVVGLVTALELVRSHTLQKIENIARSFDGSFSQVINDYFLFTLVVAVVKPAETFVFSIGDGVYAITGNMRQSGEVQKLGPFPGNAPPYLAYNLVETSLKDQQPELLKFRIECAVPTPDVEAILVGTDGVSDLINSWGKVFPSKDEEVGPIWDFWEKHEYFENPDRIRRQLALMNNASQRPDWEKNRVEVKPGLLPDDTTLVVIRRKPKED